MPSQVQPRVAAIHMVILPGRSNVGLLSRNAVLERLHIQD